MAHVVKTTPSGFIQISYKNAVPGAGLGYMFDLFEQQAKKEELKKKLRKKIKNARHINGRRFPDRH
jgi:hypothetical protein